MSIPKLIEDAWNGFENNLVSRFDSKQKKLWNIFIFLLRFLILAIPMHLLLWVNFDAHILQVITVKSVSFLLSVAGVSHKVLDVFLVVHLGTVPWTIEIIKDCVGWKSFMAVTGLIFAVRYVRLEKRLIGVILSVPIIYISNVLRIFTSIYFSLILGYNRFEFIHDILWQWGLIALVILIWWVWLEKIAYAGNNHTGRAHKKNRK